MADASRNNYDQGNNISSLNSSCSNDSNRSSTTPKLICSDNGNQQDGLRSKDSPKSKVSAKTSNRKKSVFNLTKRPSISDQSEKDNNSSPHGNLTFLDRLRSQSLASPKRFGRNNRRSSRSGSVSVLTSPINIYGSSAGFEDRVSSHTRSHYPSEGHDSPLLHRVSPSLSRPPKSPRKWYSFTNLLSRQSLSNILSLPSRSRLSVSSIFTSDDTTSSCDATPTEEPEPLGLDVFSFFESGSISNNSSRVLPPTSPTPSCATVSGEFPSRLLRGRVAESSAGAQTAITSPTFGAGSGLCNISSSSVILRRQRNASGGESFNGYGQQRSVSASAASGVSFNYTSSSTTSSSTSTICAKNYSSNFSNNSKNGNRLSCGEFFPGPAPSSPGFLGPDFQFYFYTGFKGRKDSDGQQQIRKSLGNSLPTLLEAMESAANLQGAECSVSNGNLKAEGVLNLLDQEFAILPGSKTKDEHYIIIFPDRGNFQLIGDSDFRRLMIYLTSVPSLQDSEPGFVLIIDRRNDKWNSVKTTLLRISGYFPALIHRVFVLRPVGFLQKALSEVSSKLFRTENLRFRLTVCNHVSDLISFIDPGQLIPELSGYLLYDKVIWTQQRIEVESFHSALQTLSRDLKKFTESFTDIEYPNDVSATERLILEKDEEYNGLRVDLSQAEEHGESILRRIKCFNWDKDPTKTITATCPASSTTTSAQLVNVIFVERFILQIEETTSLFEEFFAKEKRRLEQCLSLRRFEHDFRELQTSFDLNIKSLNDFSEMGETLSLTEALLTDTLNFQEVMKLEVERSIDLEIVGRNIVALNPSATDIIEPKCVELSRMASHFRFIVQEKIFKQEQWIEVQGSIETANTLCTEGMSLVTSQQLIETTEENPDWSRMKQDIDSFLQKIQIQLDALTTLKGTLNTGSAFQAKTFVKQVLRRVEDVQAMCVKRLIFLCQQLEKKVKSRRSSGSSLLTVANSAFHFDLKSTKPSSQVQCESHSDSSSIDGSMPSSLTSRTNRSSISSSVSLDSTHSNGKSSIDGNETKFLRRGHILDELLKTERTYVEEIGTILTGYRDQVISLEANKSLLPSQLTNEGNISDLKPSPNVAVLFCNLDEIYSFHAKIFLPDLSNCIQSIDLVGLCFIQRHSDFLAMYSQYCQLMPSSESLLKDIGKAHPWFLKCQDQLGHQLPLSAYLLKPVQRITKYHLLLKDLVKNSEHCDGLTEITEALECMLVVLRSVNDGMHQLAIRGYPAKLPEEGSLLLQGIFTVWTETMKNRLRLKGHQRYLFLYQKSILVCKKLGQLPSVIYDFKNKINLSEIGITEALKGSASSKKFEIWIQGRQKVFVLMAASHEMKDLWVKEIKRLLFDQLETLRLTRGNSTTSLPTGLGSGSVKSHKMLTYKGGSMNGWRSNTNTTNTGHRPLRQVSSWETSDYTSPTPGRPKSRSVETDLEEEPWSSDVSISEDEETLPSTIPPSGEKLKKSTSSNSISVYGIGENVENEPTFVVFADYHPVGTAEIPLKEGDIVVLVKVGCAGWWFVRTTGIPWMEGWAPSAYLEKHPAGFTNSTSTTTTSGNFTDQRLMKQSSLARDNNSLITKIKSDTQIDGTCSSMERKVTESLENKSSVELR